MACPPLPDLRVKPEDQGPVWDRDKIVIAHVLKVDKHPDADKLKLPQVEYGPGLTKQLVTGAPNIHVGDTDLKIILALSGSVLFDGHAAPKKLAELKPTKIRGIPSDAMVCSAYELGINDEHEGIILLEDDAPVGMPLADFMGDIVIEVDVLPNMARCLSMVGVAREVAAITGQTLKPPPTTVQAAGRRHRRSRQGGHRRPGPVAALRRRADRGREDRSRPRLDAAPTHLRRHAADQQHRRYHQLRHARMGPAAACVRLRRA